MLRLILMLTLILAFAVAQTDSSSAPDITDLRQEALRLTLESKISELPADLQGEAQDLLSRAEALREPMMAIRTKMLESYVAELQAGKEPYLAWATAKNTVADDRLALLPDVRSLVMDTRAFVNEHPEVAPIFKELRDNFTENRLQRFR